MSRTVLLAAAALCLSPLVAGCGDGTAPDDPPSSAAGSSSESDEPSDDASESEAAGERMFVDTGSVAIPEGWERDESDATSAAPADGSGGTLTIGDLGPTGPATLRQLGKALVPSTGDPELSFGTELDGEPGFVISSSASGYDDYLIGSLRDGQGVQVLASFYRADIPPAEQQRLVDELVASYAWN